MKKTISILLSLAFMILSMPMVANAAQDEGVIDKHGAKTYLGSPSDWSKSWNEDNFEEVTDKDAKFSGKLTVKAGNLKNIRVTGSDSKLTITNGTIGSIECDGDITLTGGSIKHDVESDEKITFSGKVTIGGSCTAQEITSTGSSTATVSGAIIGSDSIKLSGEAIKANEIKSDNSATLEIKNYKLPLPMISEMGTMTIEGSCTANSKINTGILTLKQKAELIARSTIDVDTLEGPGTLSFNSGKLTVHNSITDKPFIRFNNAVGNGTLAFKADSNAVEEDDVRLYDYELEKNTSNSYNSFILRNSIRDGVTFDKSSIRVDSKTPGMIKANIRPAFTQFATGTKLVWELHGDTSAFSKSEDSSKNTCKVTLNSSIKGEYKATLLAYLVDKSGYRLTDYKSDSCTITSGSPMPDPGVNFGLTLDTSEATIPIGNTYWVLAITDSATAPRQMSYNSAIATVGAATAYNSNGKVGWVYPVNAIAKGKVTIDINGQKMIAMVAGGSIVVDTASYTMSPGSKYCIGVKINKIDKKDLNIHSSNSCTTVQYAGKGSNGLDLFVITANQAGVGYVSFDIIGGQSVRTTIIIADGAAPKGVSGRLVAAQLP